MMIYVRMFKAGVFIFLLSLITLAGASAQLAPTQKAPKNVPLETYDNPPAPPRTIEISPQRRNIQLPAGWLGIHQ